MKKHIILFLLAIGFNSCSWADDIPLACENLYIYLYTSNAQACTLVNSNVITGTLLTPVPQKIIPGDEPYIILSQSANAGPKMELEYECNGKKIAFTSEQPLCKWVAGKVSGHVISTDPGIKASFKTEDGSVFWGYTGIIEWVLTAN